jgi:hypothetical protein
MLEHFGKSDWSELETDVIGGAFSPPIAGKQTASVQSRRHPRNSELRNAVIPADRFRYDRVTRTYKSTIGRLLREYSFNVLITLRDEGTTFELERAARRGLDWLSLHYRSAKSADLRMVIVNNEFAYRPNPEDETGIRVVRDGVYFVAKFRYTKANRTIVERSGFEFSPTVKWWFTLDPEVAAGLEAEIEMTENAISNSRPVSARAGGSARWDIGPPKRRQVPAWVKRRHPAKRRQLSLNLGDARKPIIRTWK